MSIDWHLIKTKRNAVKLAKINLSKQGMDVFAPLVRQTRRHGKTFVTEVKPLFSNYIFLGLTQSRPSWKTINSTIGVAYVVSLDRSFTPLPENIVEQLKARCTQDQFLKSSKPVNTDDVVKILNGPFTDFIGRVEKIAPDRRVSILFELMGNTTKINVPTENLLCI